MLPMRLLLSVYPNATFIPWLFPRVPAQFWTKRENRKAYVDWLVERTGKSREKLGGEDFRQNHGGGLYAYCGDLLSIWKSLESDDFRGKPRHRQVITPEVEKAALESVREKLGYKEGELDFWYTVTYDDTKRLGVFRVTQSYPSLYHCLLKSYPDHHWVPWKFAILKSNAARDPNVVKMAIAYAEEALNITEPKQWYKVSHRDIEGLGLRSIFEYPRLSLYEFLKKHRPEFDWKESNFASVTYVGVSHLSAFLKEIFPSHEVHAKVALSQEPRSKKSCHLIPSLRLAFHYQTDHDYGLKRLPGKRDVRLYVSRDKTEYCKARGLDLISIPFWWDRTLESLVATILLSRPSLLNEMSEAIRASNRTHWTPIPGDTTVDLSNWRSRAN